MKHLWWSHDYAFIKTRDSTADFTGYEIKIKLNF